MPIWKQSAVFKNHFLKLRAPSSAPILLSNLQFTVAAGLQFQFFKFATLWHCRATIRQAFPHRRPHFPSVETLYESKIPTRSRSPQSSCHSRPLLPSPWSWFWHSFSVCSKIKNSTALMITMSWNHSLVWFPWKKDIDLKWSFQELKLDDGESYRLWIRQHEFLVERNHGSFTHTLKPLDEIHVGFPASTENLIENHKILRWTFSNSKWIWFSKSSHSMESVLRIILIWSIFRKVDQWSRDDGLTIIVVFINK